MARGRLAIPDPGRWLTAVGEHYGIVPRSAMLTARSRMVRGLARSAVTVRLLKTIRRPEWVYLARGRIPVAHIGRRPPDAISDSDVVLAWRLIDAYRKAEENAPPNSTAEDMWSWIFKTRQRELSTALDSEDAHGLATLLATMFRQDFVLGMASGPLLSETRSKLASRIWCLRTLDWLVSLAEALGAAPVENPEQGSTGLAFEAGIDQLLAAINRELGFKLDFPRVGAPCGLEIDGHLITPDTPDQVYAAVRLDQAIGLHIDRASHSGSSPHVIEIGGGYGGMCYWFLRRREAPAHYTIVDLPIINVLQGYFLVRALGSDRVSFYGESGKEVQLIPNFALAEIETPFDVLVNKDSMPEMPPSEMMRYLGWGGEYCRGFFYSYNQEAGASFLGKSQGVVSRAVEGTGKFERLRRDGAWVRPGYVEEIYVPAT